MPVCGPESGANFFSREGLNLCLPFATLLACGVRFVGNDGVTGPVGLARRQVGPFVSGSLGLEFFLRVETTTQGLFRLESVPVDGGPLFMEVGPRPPRVHSGGKGSGDIEIWSLRTMENQGFQTH